MLAKIAEMPEPDRAMAKQLDAIIKASAPVLTAKTWYGMPAYAREGKVVEATSTHRKRYPSEARVKRGHRVVNGEKELLEKLGRNDLCPCGSGRRFQAMLHAHRRVRRLRPRSLLSGGDLA